MRERAREDGGPTMIELRSPKWIVAKGAMLAGIAVVAGGLVLAETPSLGRAALLAVLVWASCRFYYFLFYVLERYVDPTRRYTGVVDLLVARWTGTTERMP
jgi:hypothetical protein